MPVRVQRKRTKGFRMPAGVIYVGRPGKWGNPFVGKVSEQVLSDYRQHILIQVTIGELDLAELRGKDLACWCPLSSPCHADVLLELANR